MSNMKVIMENWRRAVEESEVPQQDPSQQVAAGIAAQIQALSKQIGSKKQAQQQTGQLDEVDPATLAGLAVAAPAILSLIDRVVHWFKISSKEEAKKNPTIFGRVGKFLHHTYQNAVIAALPNLIPEMAYLAPEAKKKMADIIMMIITIKMAIMSGAGAVEALKHAHSGHAAFEGALTAVKTGEVGAFLAQELKAIAGVAAAA